MFNEESFTTQNQLKRHANQIQSNQKHCVTYKSFICFPCKKSASSARNINHYHCPVCSISVRQKCNSLSHIAKHDYKNENITLKGETAVEPLFTDKEINEEKYNLNLSPLQTTKENANFKMSEKVNCDHREIELKKDSLRKEEPSCVCGDIESAIFMVPNNHVQKKKQKKNTVALTLVSLAFLHELYVNVC